MWQPLRLIHTLILYKRSTVDYFSLTLVVGAALQCVRNTCLFNLFFLFLCILLELFLLLFNFLYLSVDFLMHLVHVEGVPSLLGSCNLNIIIIANLFAALVKYFLNVNVVTSVILIDWLHL